MLAAPNAGKVEIRKVDKTFSESIDFSKSDPGRVRGNFVEGIGSLTRVMDFVEIPSANLQTVSHQDETFLSVKTRDGKSYGWITKIVEQGDKSVLYVMKIPTQKVTSPFKFSLSEVEKVWAKRFDIAKTKLAVWMMGIGIVMCLIVAKNKPRSHSMEWGF